MTSFARLHPRTTALAALALAAGVTLSACGSSVVRAGGSGLSANPLPANATDAQKVTNALTSLGNAQSLQMVLSLKTGAVMAKQIQSGSDGATPPQADLFEHGAVTITTAAPAGQTLAQTEKAGASTGAFSMDLSDSAGSLAGITVVDKTLYAHADLSDWSSITGQQLGPSLEHAASSLPAAEPAVKALEGNGWLSVTPSAFGSLTKELGGAPSSQPSLQAAAQGLSQKLLDDLQGASTATTAPSAPAGEQAYLVTVKAKQFVDNALSDLSSLVPAMSGPLGAQLPDIPDTATVAVTVDVKDGIAQDVSVDLAQYLPAQPRAQLASAGEPFALDIALKTGVPAPTAPANATNVDSVVTSLLSSLAAFAPQVGAAGL